VGNSWAQTRAFLIVALALSASLIPAAHADPTAVIVRADFVAVDTNANGLDEYLNITLALSPPTTANYLANATLIWPAGNTVIASTTTQAQLAAGAAVLTLRIEGPTINEKQLDGPFTLAVRLTSAPAGTFDDNATFTSPPYLASDFESAPQGDRPHLQVGQDAVRVSSPWINASVNLTRPELTYAAAGAAGGGVVAAFRQAIAFDDADGNGAFSEPEARCAADLGAAPFGLSSLEVGPSPDFGSFVRFTLTAAVAFGGAACPVPVGGQASLSFLITQRNGTVPGPLPVPVQGGLELKVDLRLLLNGSLPGTDIAFQVDLKAQAPNATYLVRGPGGYEQLDPAAGDLGTAALGAPSQAEFDRVAAVNATGAVVGYFAWLTLADETLASGQQRFAQVTASRALANGTLTVYLAAPAGGTLASVGLDPLAGVVVNAAAPPLGQPPPPPPPPRPSALVFAAALAAVSAMFFFSVYARAKKY
jgi:hypothetical protein